MSQIILDDQLADIAIRGRLAQWTRAQRLRDLRPGEVIKDERVPMILRELRQPTFVTIDMGFWNARLPEFATKAARMGKVARVSQSHIDYWQLGDEYPHRVPWPETTQRKGGVIREQGPGYEFEALEVPAAEDQSFTDFLPRTLIQVQGPPVSQTIIEERR